MEMALRSRVAGQHTTAVLNYYQTSLGQDDERRPGSQEVNLHDAEFTPRRCVMTDIRGEEEEWTLLDNGVQIFKTESPATAYDICIHLEKITGCHSARHFDRHELDEDALKMPGTNSLLIQIDDTVKSAEDKIRRLFGRNGEGIIERGYMLVDAWRPLHEAQRMSLAFADSAPRHASRIDEDLIPVRRDSEKGPPDNHQFYCLKHGDGWDGPDRHHWSFLNQQSSNETILLKVAEKREGMARAAGTPKTFFDTPGSTSQAPSGWKLIRIVVMFGGPQGVGTSMASISGYQDCRYPT